MSVWLPIEAINLEPATATALAAVYTRCEVTFYVDDTKCKPIVIEVAAY